MTDAEAGRSRTLLLVTAALLVALVAGLAVIVGQAGGGRTGGDRAGALPRPRSSPVAVRTSVPSPPALAPSANYPVVPGHVALYLHLPQPTAPADGSPVSASVYLVNGLGHPFVVPDACNQWLGAGLDAPGQPFDMLNGLVGCQGHPVAVGATVFTVRISTAYGGCAEPDSQGTAGMPRCAGPDHNQLPDFAPGRYPITIKTFGVPSPVVPRAQSLTLTPA